MIKINNIYNVNELEGLKQVKSKSIDFVYFKVPSFDFYFYRKLSLDFLMDNIAYIYPEYKIDTVLDKLDNKEEIERQYLYFYISQINRILKDNSILFIDNLKKSKKIIQDVLQMNNITLYRIYERFNIGVYTLCDNTKRENIQKCLDITGVVTRKITNLLSSENPKPLYELLLDDMTKEDDTVISVFSDLKFFKYCKIKNRDFIGFEENKQSCEYLITKLEIVCEQHIKELEQLTTGALLSYLNSARSSEDKLYIRRFTHSRYSIPEIKYVLGKREHYPNKKERKRIRQLKAQKKLKSVV